MFYDPNGLAVPGDLSAHTAPMPPNLQFNDQAIRVSTVQDRQFLSASDVCRALELPIGGKLTPARYIRHIDNREKAYQPFPTGQGAQMSVGLTVAGAIALASPPRRKRVIDEQFREWIMSAHPEMYPAAQRASYTGRKS